MNEGVRVSGADTSSKLSDTIWGRCPLTAIQTGQVKGVVVGGMNEFSSFNKTPATTEGNWAAGAGYAQFSSTGTTLTAIPLSAATAAGLSRPGVRFTSDDDNDAGSIRTLSVPFSLNRASKAFWFECCVRKSSIANTIAEFFVGLLEDTALTAIVPITTTAATLSDNNMVGFYATESAGSKASTTYKANGVTAVVVGADEATFVANTDTKLGMRFVPSGDRSGAYILSFYQDGTRLTSTKQLPTTNGLDFPTDVAMGLVFAARNAAGSTPGTVDLRWWQAAQLYDN